MARKPVEKQVKRLVASEWQGLGLHVDDQDADTRWLSQAKGIDLSLNGTICGAPGYFPTRRFPSAVNSIIPGPGSTYLVVTQGEIEKYEMRTEYGYIEFLEEGEYWRLPFFIQDKIDWVLCDPKRRKKGGSPTCTEAAGCTVGITYHQFYYNVGPWELWLYSSWFDKYVRIACGDGRVKDGQVVWESGYPECVPGGWVMLARNVSGTPRSYRFVVVVDYL